MAENGAGISSVGAINLFNMTIVGNNAQSAPNAQGGGIYSSGAVSLKYSKVSSNNAVGSFDTGASAQGGGIYIANNSLTLVASTITDNVAQGGSGIPGRNSMDDGFDCTQEATTGGKGGDAAGGGVYKSGTATVSGDGFVFNNTTIGGLGGSGGNGNPPCGGSAASGASGTARGSNIAP